MSPRGALALALLALAGPRVGGRAMAADAPAADVAAVQQLAWDGKLDEALAGADRLLASGRREPALRRVRADCLAWTNRLDAALAAYTELLAESPGDVSVGLAIALVHKWQGDLARAEEEMAALAVGATTDRELAEQLRLVRADPALPLARARAAVTRAPTDVAALRVLMDMALAEDRFWEAEEALARARVMAPADRDIQALTAEFEQRKTARLAARVTERRVLLAAAPDDTAQRVALAEDLAALKRLDEAATEYATAARAEPTRRELRVQEAKVRSWAGDYGRALALYDQLLAEAPGDDEVRVERARILAWNGRLTAAARTLDAVADDTRPEVQGLLGDVYRWAGAPRRAAEHYQRAVDAGLDGEAGASARTFIATQSRFVTAGPVSEWFSDSTDFRALRFGAEAARQANFATRIEGRFVHADYAQHAQDLSAERGAVTLVHDWWLLRGLVQVGVNGYSTGSVTPGASVQLEMLPVPQQAVGVAYDHYDLIDEVATVSSATKTPGAAGGDVLQGNRARVWFQQMLPLDLQLSTTGAFSAITDGNNARGAALTLGRRVLRWPSVEARADVRYYGVGVSSPRYWSPAQYVSTGLSVQIDQPLRWGLHLLLEGRGGYAEEDDVPGAEMSWGSGLVYRGPSGWELSLIYRTGETARVGGYTSQLLTFRLQRRFGG